MDSIKLPEVCNKQVCGYGGVIILQVDVNKVNKDIIKRWIAERVNELSGVDDEIIEGYACNLLDIEATEKVCCFVNEL